MKRLETKKNENFIVIFHSRPSVANRPQNALRRKWQKKPPFGNLCSRTNLYMPFAKHCRLLKTVFAKLRRNVIPQAAKSLKNFLIAHPNLFYSVQNCLLARCLVQKKANRHKNTDDLWKPSVNFDYVVRCVCRTSALVIADLFRKPCRLGSIRGRWQSSLWKRRSVLWA